MNKKGILFLIVVALFFSFDAYSQGCSQCKMLAEQSSELDEASFGSNINMGILYLMTIPYILLFLLFRKRIFSFVRSLKKPNRV
jgi:hypothetical protein